MLHLPHQSITTTTATNKHRHQQHHQTNEKGVLTAPERATLAIVVRLRALTKLSMERLASIGRRASSEALSV